jgi:Outer membrane receptor proteins, mostly Fe transport
MKWQAGLFAFTQNYQQDAVNNFSPFVLSPFINFPISQHSPQSTLDDRGLGIYGQTTWTFSKNLDVVAGVRADREHKEAALSTFFAPALPAFGPAVTLSPERDFTDVSPQFAVTYRLTPAANVYGTVARGFKAGGFNAASPTGAEAYNPEHTWNFEGGIKASAASNRVTANLAAFHISWDDLQVFIPNPLVPGQFFIGNSAGATSSGVEFELHARPDRSVDLFGGAGFTHARFSGGSFSERRRRQRQDAVEHAELYGGLRRPVCASAARRSVADGARRSDLLRQLQVRRREHGGPGRVHVDEPPRGTARQARVRRTAGSACVRHPVHPRGAAVSGLAPSGFVGEAGAPRTFGLRAGVTF